jgi:hypothetical protein
MKNREPRNYWELWQLEKYGNILEDQRPQTIEEPHQEEPMPTSEESYIFELENPE